MRAHLILTIASVGPQPQLVTRHTRAGETPEMADALCITSAQLGHCFCEAYISCASQSSRIIQRQADLGAKLHFSHNFVSAVQS